MGAILCVSSGCHAGEAAAIRAGQSDSIAYSKVFAAILEEAGIKVDFISAPHGRKRRMFLDGVIALDCCASPIWRQAPGEDAVQLFSDAFHHSPEHYVFKKDQVIPIPTPEALRKLRVAKVRGFNYQYEDYFGSTVEVRDMEDVLDMLVAGRAQVGMINQQDFYRRMRLRPRMLELGEAHYIADLRVRVHKDHADFLPAINEAIARLQKRGVISAILQEVSISGEEAKPQKTVEVKVSESSSPGFQLAWRAILQEANIRPEFVDMPEERKRRMFTNGEIMLDCCTAPMWRVRPEEVNAQLWSDTFYLTREQYVFRAGEVREIVKPEDLLQLRVAVVTGFEYEDRPFFGVAVEGRDLSDVLKLLAADRADVGIISNVDFYTMTKDQPDTFELGGIRIRAQQKIRVHRAQAHLLPRINAAITRLNRDGILVELLEGNGADNLSAQE
ncbi:substrate-binding periplasmic protein [Kordiimonas sp.]|uniref:substrate-binding periplasmic protein n=1 Tax=Kordiimonas sp. TaxID=1970157 RepID=UPI003B51F9F8